MTMLGTLDEVLYLQGDEDGDVGVQCRRCYDRGGLPVVFYTTNHENTAYQNNRDRVAIVHSITGLLVESLDHLDNHKPAQNIKT